MKQCGIVSQLTPPGTPQRNGVSERHNHTLLDMVQSMMSLTKDRTISNKVRLRRSDTPLRCGVPCGVNYETIPHCLK